MKTMVRLAVLFASLLMVTSAAFAVTSCPPCYGVLPCYSVAGTDLTNPANSFTGQYWLICFNGTDSFVCVGGNEYMALSPFTQGLNPQALGYSTNRAAYMTFHGSYDGAFNGILFDSGDQFRLHGIQTYDCPD